MSANGFASIFYDILSILHAMIKKNNSLLILGVSGAICLPLVRFFTKTKIITNIDGIEWRREKWGKLEKKLLRILEKVAVRFSDVVISDNVEIQKYIYLQYGRHSKYIPYGGEHAIDVDEKKPSFSMPVSYCLKIARIEPENNIVMILLSFSKMPKRNLVIIGNWNSSKFGKRMRKKYSRYKNIIMLDPIYDRSVLKWIRMRAKCYLHGHSAGGSNPTLIEAMYFKAPIIAYDCVYNRATTDNRIQYFSCCDSLIEVISNLFENFYDKSIIDLRQFALKNFNWKDVTEKYLNVIFDA